MRLGSWIVVVLVAKTPDLASAADVLDGHLARRGFVRIDGPANPRDDASRLARTYGRRGHGAIEVAVLDRLARSVAPVIARFESSGSSARSAMTARSLSFAAKRSSRRPREQTSGRTSLTLATVVLVDRFVRVAQRSPE